ncbi:MULTISPECIES: PIN domain-containing protein [Methylobacterium]|uniref:PIN domain-containing protein n=1 Tax=Methylobacterium TaxID=407 RepID=UPI0011C88793|nr:MULTISPECIES: PIN domain-containing protein [Methylobacterium]TXN20206.1 type II toxin-antitoxin system VapC family toxin [Methylobacterium sp. WL9]
MTRFLLDTNIISNSLKPAPAPRLAEWMAEQRSDSLFIASMTVAELQRGILSLQPGRKRATLQHWLEGPGGLLALFAGRVLPFDTKAALAWAALMADGRKAGRPRSPLDMILAATADVHGCIVATDNERDFEGLRFMNPLRPADTRQ